MENQIIQQLGQTLQGLLPEVKRQVKSLKDFAIFSGATLKMKAPEGLKELVDAKMWYITMKFDGTAVMRVINDENSPVFEISWRDSYRPLTAFDQLGYAWNRVT